MIINVAYSFFHCFICFNGNCTLQGTYTIINNNKEYTNNNNSNEMKMKKGHKDIKEKYNILLLFLYFIFSIGSSETFSQTHKEIY